MYGRVYERVQLWLANGEATSVNSRHPYWAQGFGAVVADCVSRSPYRQYALRESVSAPSAASKSWSPGALGLPPLCGGFSGALGLRRMIRGITDITPRRMRGSSRSRSRALGHPACRVFSTAEPERQLDLMAARIQRKRYERQALLLGFSGQIGQFFLVDEDFPGLGRS